MSENLAIYEREMSATWKHRDVEFASLSNLGIFLIHDHGEYMMFRHQQIYIEGGRRER